MSFLRSFFSLTAVDDVRPQEGRHVFTEPFSIIDYYYYYYY